jgi:hypothetical protein
MQVADRFQLRLKDRFKIILPPGTQDFGRDTLIAVTLIEDDD